MKKLLLSTAMALAISGAHADTITKSWPVDQNWTAMQWQNDKGEFSYCSAGVDYKSGSSVVLAIVGGFPVVAFVDPEWTFNPGSEYDVSIWTDRDNKQAAHGRALTEHSIGARYDSPDIFESIAKAKTLYLAGKKVHLTFDLSGSRKALEAVAKCWLDNAKTNPFGEPQPTPETEVF